MKDLMIDIETMGNTHNAAMLQLAGVFFDRFSGETGSEFCQNIDLGTCLDEGFKENQSTRDWWATQNQEVFKAITSNTKPVRDVMRDFFRFIGRDRDLIVWSHATFDFVIVQNYLKTLKAGYMPFRGARDIRTLVDLSGIDLNAYDWSTGKTHNALDDCKFQIKYCVDAINALRQ
jgi:hypothetical protein